MKLTIEKAKDIVNHPENYCDIGPLGHAQTWKAKGFIEGWNQAIEKCAEIVDRQLDIESETGGEEELTTSRNLILMLKVKGEK